MARKLKYVGSGQWLPGVPAQDHTCEDDRQAAQLVKSGLYEYASSRGADAERAGDSTEEEASR